jgi:hypothetical protein
VSKRVEFGSVLSCGLDFYLKEFANMQPSIIEEHHDHVVSQQEIRREDIIVAGVAESVNLLWFKSYVDTNVLSSC